MNKRILAVVIAVAALLAGCNKKKVEEEIPDGGTYTAVTTVESVTKKTAVTTAEPATEKQTVTEVQETTERVFRAYKEKDFDTIEVSWTMSSGEAPAELNCIDISGLDFGEKIPVCFKSENAGQFYNNDEDISAWKKLVDKPVKGYAVNCFSENGYCYVYVVYPCIDTSTEIIGLFFDWSMFRYDPESGGLKEIYSWSAKDMNEICLLDNCFGSGGFFFIYQHKEGEEFVNTVKKLDLSSLEITDVHVYKENYESEYFVFSTDQSMNVRMTNMDFTNSDKGETYVYDPEKGKFINTDEIGGYGDVKGSYTGAGHFSLLTSMNKDSTNSEVVGESYSIEVPVTAAKIIYADEDRLILHTYNQLHTYDLKKMEHYVSELRIAAGQPLLSGEMAEFDGKLIMIDSNQNNSQDGYTPVYCLIPDKGLIYKLIGDGLIYFNLREMKDGVSFELFDSGYNYVEKFYTVKSR